MLLAQITDRGPSGEPDFTDERYWVARADGPTVPAVNVAEAVDGTHRLSADQRVTVSVHAYARPSLRHTFSARPAPPGTPPSDLPPTDP